MASRCPGGWRADVSDSWESVEQYPERLVDLDSERMAVVFTVRDGRAVRMEAYDSLEQALEDS